MKWMWIPASQAGAITKMEPVWFDVDQCGDSEVSVPAGPSTKSYSWTVNRPGKIIGLGGHIHNGGINVDFPVTVSGLISSRRELRGTIGSGGPRIRASATNGGITITRR